MRPTVFFILTLLVGLSYAHGALADVAFDAKGSTAITIDASTCRVPLTVSTAANRVVLVGVTYYDNYQDVHGVANISYPGATFTLLKKVVVPNAHVHTELWLGVAPLSGSADLTVNMLHMGKILCGAVALNGVDQTNPVTVVTSALSAVTPGTASLSLFSDSSDMVIGVYGCDSCQTASMSGTSAWTSLLNIGTGGGSTIPGASLVGVSWTANWKSPDMALIGANIHAAGSTDTTVTPTPTPTTPGVDTIVPSTPMNLSATPLTSTAIKLVWSPSTDNVAVVGYQVFRGKKLLTRTSLTEYTDTGLKANTQYAFRVAAYDAAGNVSSKSTRVLATTLSNTTSSAPTLPVVTLSANPTSVAYNGTSVITWASTNATSCSLSSGQSGISGSFTTPQLTANKSYSVSCTGTGGTTSKTLTVTVASAPLPSSPTPVPTLSAGCSYGSSFMLREGMDTTKAPAMTKPAKGAYFMDPTYGTCVVRATDHVTENGGQFIRNDYSRRQAFNADSSKFLAYAEKNQSWFLYDAVTLAKLKELTVHGTDIEPQWHPADPNLFYFGGDAGGLTISEYNITNDTVRVVGNFNNSLRPTGNKLPWSGVAAVWTKDEGSPSADGRYWAFMAQTSNYNTLGFFVWDKDTDTIVSTYTTTAQPDHISMSPSGLYVVPSWDYNVGLKGTWVFNRDFTNPRQLSPRSEHSDLALAANGDDMYVFADYDASENVTAVNLRTMERINLFPIYVNGTWASIHVSGKSFKHPGWVVVSSYADNGGTAPGWYLRKIIAVELKANPRVYVLAHARDLKYSNNYWDEPHASSNADLTKIMFNSNWDTGTLDVDDYMIQLPQGAIPPATFTLKTQVTQKVLTSAEISQTIFARDLMVGTEGEDVRDLQRFLNAQGFAVATGREGSPGQETTFFGRGTEIALARFQAAHGIYPTSGYLGIKTRTYIRNMSK